MEGLSSEQAKIQVRKFGKNEIPDSAKKGRFHLVLDIFKEPMFLLLISCGVLYMLLGDFREGFILLSTIIIIIFITIYQNAKTENALSKLKQLSSPRALVLRDGKETRIAGNEVVVDDVILINEGDRIPADAILTESNHLKVDESLLTGESLAVEKSTEEGKNTLFSGTLVISGNAKAKVSSIGSKTEMGKIGHSLQSIEQSGTRLQTEMKGLIKGLFILGGIISVITVLAFYFSRGNFIQSLLNGLAATMAILPEEFPVVLTIFLALGAWRLSKKNVLTRKPSAIESLGSATVLCSDKTGTITLNRMDVTAVMVDETLFENDAIVQNNGTVLRAIEVANLSSRADSIDTMDSALSRKAESLKLSKIDENLFIQEYPLQSDFTAISRVYTSNNKCLVYTKGSPESVFELCGFDASTVEKQLKLVNEMATKGLRVLGVAEGQYDNVEKLPKEQAELKLKFIGLIGFEDPIRPEVPAAIKECSEAGISVKMITGDFPLTAETIAKKIGLSTQEGILTGDEIETLNDVDLQKKVKSIHVFARVKPEQKLRIVHALKANNEIVAMTGDGVNDAPALKASDIGIAMGMKGTDVAREASSLVLLDDNFASIVAAIRSGRKIFDNLQKSMSYIMSIHMPIIGLTLLPAFFGNLPILLMPIHIVFMELIIDPVCSIAFESEPEEKGIMQRPPRPVEEKFFGWRKIIASLFRGLLLLIMVLVVYFLSIKEGHSEGEVRAIAFTSLIIGNIFLILTDLSNTRSFIWVFKGKNKAALILPSIAFAVLMIVLNTETGQVIFNFDHPGHTHFIPSLIGAGSLLLLIEFIKLFKLRKGIV
ncbi:MAG TPA: cation-translocating P-type ATPase [Bacteroidia bacterium]